MRDVVITEVQYSGPSRRSRNLEERFLVRFPSLVRRGRVGGAGKDAEKSC